MDDRSLAKILWDYMCLREIPEQGDLILGFGCYNEDVARRAAQLYRQGYAPKVVFTGGLGRNTQNMWTQSEAERFGAIALAEGVPEEAVLLENRSTNTGENFRFTRELLAKNGIAVKKVIAVQKPYMERRLKGAFPVYWPEVAVSITSWQQNYEEYLAGLGRWGRTEQDTIEMLVGDVQRIWLYAGKGFQIGQAVPRTVLEAFEELIHKGYTGQLVGNFSMAALEQEVRACGCEIINDGTIKGE